MGEMIGDPATHNAAADDHHARVARKGWLAVRHRTQHSPRQFRGQANLTFVRSSTMNATNVSLPADAPSDAVLDALQQRLEQLTPELRKAAAYVLENPNEVGVSSIREIADAAEVKPGSFVRMARAIGFDGYDDFREPFREEIRRGASPFPDRARWLQSLAKGGKPRLALCEYGGVGDRQYRAELRRHRCRAPAHRRRCDRRRGPRLRSRRRHQPRARPEFFVPGRHGDGPGGGHPESGERRGRRSVARVARATC